MDDAAKIILKKLEEIDGRLKKIEGDEKPVKQEKKDLRDPLFAKATQVIQKYDEVTTTQMQKLLVVDQVRAEKILDQLEEAGLGQCVWEDR